LDPVQRESMLDLVRRIGTEFGIHVVLSSHLLEEVERVCDAVVILAQGRVVTEGTLTSLRQGDGAVVIELDSDATAMAARLVSIGFSAVADGRRLLVDGETDAVADAVRDAAIALDAGLRRIERRRVTLEDVYLGRES
jgi:ABC-2 type transport system ATP-binding protein